MMRSLFSGVSGLKNHQTAMDVIGNNVANVNTTAFKASKVVFQDIVSQTVSEATAATTNGGGQNAKQIGLGMSIASITKDMTEGSTQSTDGPLDFAIQGEGYFVVKDGDSITYTRSGSLSLDKDGNLVTANGAYVQGVLVDNGDPNEDDTKKRVTITAKTDDTDEKVNWDDARMSGGAQLNTTEYLQNITIDGSKYTDYAIDSNGIITATKPADTTAGTPATTVTLGRIVLATFNNPAGLNSVGNSTYAWSNNSGDPNTLYVNDNSGVGTIQSGELEMSNVSLATELTNMIIIQRGFQANSRVITTSDTMLEELVNLKR